MAYDSSWETVVQVLKDRGLLIDRADKDAGQIKTEFQIVDPKKPRQRGMRYIVDFKRVSESETGLRVAALDQTRTYRLQAEPWEEPKYNAEASEPSPKQSSTRRPARSDRGPLAQGP